MYWTILVIANIPVYLFIGYVLFNSKTGSSTTIADTILALLKIIFIPRLLRVLFDIDTDDAVGLFDIITFLVMCVAVTYGEHWLLSNYVFAK